MSDTLIVTEEKQKKGYSLSIGELNEMFRPLHYTDRIRKLYELFKTDDVLYTSSFGTKSVFLLDAIMAVNSGQRVHFIDTTYHFKETIQYKNYLQSKYDIEIVDILPNPVENKLTADEEWWKDHPRMCCTINKLAPLDPIILQHKIWMSGLMGNQTDLRSRLDIFEKKGDIIKFYPIVDLEKKGFEELFSQKNLDKHPLLEQGYGSVGCTNCTTHGEDRSGRWCNTQQTECGLHLSYFYDKKKK